MISYPPLPNKLETERTILRPIREDDAEAMFAAYTQDGDVARYMIWEPHKTLANTRAWAEHCAASDPKISRPYLIFDRHDNVLLGSFHLRRTIPGQVECGYLLVRKWWGRGLMTEVLSMIVDWAATDPQTTCVMAVCDIDNLGSARVMEKAGLEPRGLLPRHILHPNISAEPRDCLSYAKDFPAKE